MTFEITKYEIEALYYIVPPEIIDPALAGGEPLFSPLREAVIQGATFSMTRIDTNYSPSHYINVLCTIAKSQISYI